MKKTIILISILFALSINASSASVNRMICRISDQYASISLKNVRSYSTVKFAIYDERRKRIISKRILSINRGWANIFGTATYSSKGKRDIPKHKIRRNSWIFIEINGKTEMKECKG